MKPHLPRFTLAAAAIILALGAGHTPATRAQSAPPSSSDKPAPKKEAPTQLPAEALLAEIKSTRFADRAALHVKLQEAERRFGDKLIEWESKKNALPEREKADADEVFQRLAAQREVLRQKTDEVEGAREETWNSATEQLYVSLQNAISTYKQLMALFSS